MVCFTLSTCFLHSSFANPRCLPALTTIEVMAIEVDQSEVTKELEKSASVGN